MDSVTSSSNEDYDRHRGLMSDSQLPQLPPYGFLPPNSQPVFGNHSISKHLQPIPVVQSHMTVVAESNRLGDPDSSNPDYLNALLNCPPTRPLGFADQSLNMDAAVLRNPAPLVMENAVQGSIRSAPTTQSMRTNKATRRNRKKRTRASRKPQTTVMMTDTANFQAMVQEFTGIPATSLVPSHLHRAGIGLLGPNRSGLGSDMEPQLTYGDLLMGPFAPKTKSATCSDHSLSTKLSLPSGLGILKFQSLAQGHDPTAVMESRSQDRSDRHPILPRTSVGGECTNELVNHSALMVDFNGDRAVQDDVNLRAWCVQVCSIY